MSLYGNRVYIVRTFCGIQTFDDLICQNFIFYPAVGILIILSGHIFFGCKGIKSKIREYISSAIKVRFIVMYCMSGISQTFQHIRSTLAGSLFQNTLIRIFSWSEIMHAHSGDRFELCVGSSCANRRNLIVS